MNVFNKLASKKHEAAKSARERYIRLLARLDSTAPNEQDTAELESLLTELKIGHDRAADDHKLVQDAMSDHAFAVRVDELQRAIEPVAEAFAKACEERQAAYHRHNAIVQAARAAEEDAQQQFQLALNARGRLVRLSESDSPTAGIIADVFSATTTKRKK